MEHPKYYAIAVAIYNEKGEVLIVQEPDTDLWGLPFCTPSEDDEEYQETETTLDVMNVFMNNTFKITTDLDNVGGLMEYNDTVLHNGDTLDLNVKIGQINKYNGTIHINTVQFPEHTWIDVDMLSQYLLDNILQRFYLMQKGRI